MKFARESYSPDLIAEMIPLWKAHYQETQDELYGPLDPELRVYETAWNAGVMRVFTVRQAGVLHGYQVFFVSKHIHSRESVQATQDILYLSPDARKGLVGYRFIRWCGEQLKAEGVQIVHQHISVKHDFGALLIRLGYQAEDITYSKRLQEVA